MSKQWHDNDWLISILAGIAIVITIIANYLYNGGRL
jgi:hypothetical protein